ncbi:MAG: sugar ABC transporter substrate-binding protein [Oscillospiraceae bacterium]|jgi:putative aldouronate transport system substrate-binding protein|nr:sugar ABC transporter substrate-binding protein [Oscillospiraceae bacterium]
MKRTISILLIVALFAVLLAACDGEPAATSNDPTATPPVTSTAPTAPPPTLLDELGLDTDLKFTETRSITVEVFDRGQDAGKTKPEDSYYSKWIQEQVLATHHIDVTFTPIDRWGEADLIGPLLAGGDAPDVCVTYNKGAIDQYAAQGGVVELAQYLDTDDYKGLLPNLFSLLTEDNIFWDQNTDGSLYSLEGRLMNPQRINTFVREDWLTALNLTAPTNIDEFEAMLVAFKEGAATLLGSDAARMVPFSTSYDVGWRIDHLAASFVPSSAVTNDKEFYTTGFDDRHLQRANYKEAVRKLNDWYNKGLVWKDFALYPAGDTTEDDMIKSGYVGSFIHNWDYPYRSGLDGIQGALQTVKPDAAFIAVESFKDDAGNYTKFLSGPVDRKIFFPSSNEEVTASFLYLDWMATFENYNFLQIGNEGVVHEKQADGSVKVIAATNEEIQNSQYNIDYTITMNGLSLATPEATAGSIAFGYGGIDSRLISIAFAASINDGHLGRNPRFGALEAESGMDTVLKEKRDALLDQSVVASVADFDSVWDAGWADYLASGGQAIIDSRIAKWEELYGSATQLP